MKQKSVSVGLITSNGKILLVRRKGGRPSIRGLYELPSGKIHRRMQPEDALAAGMRTHLGVSPASARLCDAVTFVDPDDRQLQYLFVVYDTTISDSISSFTLSDEYDAFDWKSKEAIDRASITQSTAVLLGLEPLAHAAGTTGENISTDAKITTLIAYTDGGSRGNPGPAAAGYILVDPSGRMVAEGGEYLGHTTNVVAEYTALYLALKRAVELGASEVEARLDSQLVVDWENGKNDVNNTTILALQDRVAEQKKRLEKVHFRHIPREDNVLADGIVNRILDRIDVATESL